MDIGSTRETRAYFYRTTKLLFHSGCEASPIALSQAAILLSFWSTPVGGVKNPNTFWLRTAIQLAKEVKANYYGTSYPLTTNTERRLNTLKRLWWCCIIRDRIMPLATRRGIEIKRTDFDFTGSLPLCASDLTDEIDRSAVYNSHSKRCLLGIMEQLCMLCVRLTDALSLIFSDNGCPLGYRSLNQNTAEDAAGCRSELQEWHHRMTLRFAEFESERSNGSHCIDQSILLHMCLTELYYQSAQLAISNYEVFHHVASSSLHKPSGWSQEAPRSLERTREELRHVDSCISEVLQKLVNLRLISRLPLSASVILPSPSSIVSIRQLLTYSSSLALVALPLVFQLVRGWLSSFGCSNLLGPHDADEQGDAKQRKLLALTEAFHMSQKRYDGADYVHKTVYHTARLAQVADPAGGDSRGWSDVLLSDPKKYLEMVLTMDLALSQNSLPEEDDYPINLRSFCKSSVMSHEPLPVAQTIPDSIGHACDSGRTARPDHETLISNHHVLSQEETNNDLGTAETLTGLETNTLQLQNTPSEPEQWTPTCMLSKEDEPEKEQCELGQVVDRVSGHKHAPDEGLIGDINEGHLPISLDDLELFAEYHGFQDLMEELHDIL
ncbi:unnamed protein product [Clonostachys byssicola]|uniref:Xylanolytic transcriptional activator regulatory domain-containing protein n=1 Tax=Clonostachys byssicola TaxID=160290 RepID=A0A9N9TYS1_9HYPO|nr:unnamed protein product [Clonostachys byssicola]